MTAQHSLLSFVRMIPANSTTLYFILWYHCLPTAFTNNLLNMSFAHSILDDPLSHHASSWWQEETPRSKDRPRHKGESHMQTEKKGAQKKQLARAAIPVLREQLGSLPDLFPGGPMGSHSPTSTFLCVWVLGHINIIENLLLLSHCHFQSEKSRFRVEFALPSKVGLIRLQNCVVREPWHYHRVRKLNLKLEPDHSSQWRSHALCQDIWRWILFNNFCIIV